MKVDITRRDILLDGFFKVEAVDLRHELFSGQWSPLVRRFNLDRGEAVAVLIYIKDRDAFVLVRQFRYAAHTASNEGWIDEIVAGVIEDDSPLECAKRECMEEAGFDIDRFEPLGVIFSSPGITTERIHLFLGICDSADRKYAGGGLELEEEDIKVLEIPRQEAWERLIQNRFRDGKTILALQHFFLKEPKP